MNGPWWILVMLFLGTWEVFAKKGGKTKADKEQKIRVLPQYIPWEPIAADFPDTDRVSYPLTKVDCDIPDNDTAIWASFNTSGSHMPNFRWVNRSQSITATGLRVYAPSTHVMTQLSYSDDLLYIHNHKVAGASIRRAFFPYYYCNKVTTHILMQPGDKCKHGKWHWDIWASLYTSEGFSELADRLWFSVVRNPWTRVVSLYRHAHHMKVKHRSDYSWIDFIDDIGALATKAVSQLHHRPQFLGLIDDHGRWMVDFIGRLEHLDTDFPEFLRAIGDQDLMNFYLTNGLQKHSHHDPMTEPPPITFNKTQSAFVSCWYRVDILLWGYSIPDKYVGYPDMIVKGSKALIKP